MADVVDASKMEAIAFAGTYVIKCAARSIRDACYGLRAVRIGEASHPGPPRQVCPSCFQPLQGCRFEPGDACGMCGDVPTPGGRGFQCDPCAVKLCAGCRCGLQDAAMQEVDNRIAPTMVDDSNALPATDYPDAAEGAFDAAEAWAEPPPPKRTRALDAIDGGIAAQGTVEDPGAMRRHRAAALHCPWCGFSSHSESGLIHHIGSLHAGAELLPHADFFQGIGRNVCCQCGFLRSNRNACCMRCRSTAPARTIVAGDVVLASEDPRRGAARDAAGAVDSQPVSDSQSRSQAGHRINGTFDGITNISDNIGRQHRGRTPDIPIDFLARCDAITAPTLIHAPPAVREKLCAIFGDVLEGCLDNDPAWATLAQGAPRLLLVSVPRGAHITAELQKRLSLWESGHIGTLLARIEQQQCVKFRSTLKASTDDVAKAGAKRACRLAREGARSKAVGGLRGGIKTLSPMEQVVWAAKLIPASQHPDTTVLVQGDGRGTNTNGSDTRSSAPVAAPATFSEGVSPLKGVRFGGRFGARSAAVHNHPLHKTHNF